MPRDWRGLLAALLAFLAAGGLSVVIATSSDNGDRTVTVHVGHAASVPSSVKVDGPDADGKLDDTLTTSPAARQSLNRALEAGQSELASPLRQPNDSPATRVVPGPLAADETPGCRTRFVGNSSSRGGVRPSLIFLHQTVSHENGWQSQNALTALAASRSSGVSWHYAIGRSDGLCTYTVPLALKAWTQSNANRAAVGIEVEGYGDEGDYVTGAGKAKLVSVVRYVAHRYGIPLQRGAVSRSTCAPIRPGIVEHADAGLCGGGHVDVTLAPSDAASYIARLARAGDSSSSSSSSSPSCGKYDECRYPSLKRLTPNERSSSRTLLRERRTAHRHGGWSKIAATHLRSAEHAKTAMSNRRAELRRLGLTAKLDRRLRYDVLGRVIAAK